MNRDIRDRDTEQVCTVTMIKEEQAEELASAGMANNAARRRPAMAVLKSTLAKAVKQWDNGRGATIVS